LLAIASQFRAIPAAFFWVPEAIGINPTAPQDQFLPSGTDGRPDPILQTFFRQVTYLSSTVRPETETVRAKAIKKLLGPLQGQRELLRKLVGFIEDDWEKRLFRSIQSLEEVLEIALAEQAIYARLGIALPRQLSLPEPGDDLIFRDTTSIRSQTIGDTPYSLQIHPGIGGAHGGFEFRISALSDIVAKIGFHVGFTRVDVVYIQAGEDYRSHYNQWCRLQKEHPFDWLLKKLATCMTEAGYQRIRGCSFRYNVWVQLHIQNGDFPPERASHFKKVYDDRFARFMDPHPEFEGVFESPLPLRIS